MDQNGFYYVVDGQALPLWPSDTAKFVTAAKDSHPVHVGARLARSTRLSIDTGVPPTNLVVRGDVDKLREIRSYPDISHTRGAFIDHNGYEFILTDDVLVQFTSSSEDGERQALCDSLDCRVLQRKDNTWKLRVLDTQDNAPLNVANTLSAEDAVEYAEPNALQRARFHQFPAPSDPRFANQWHLLNAGQSGGTQGADVKALDAWRITRGSQDVEVVIHDTGVDTDHPDLSANVASGWDFDNDDSGASNDNEPHGTACAGVVAAEQSGIGVVGIAPNCRTVPLRAAGGLTWETWAETFEWAAQNGVIISCSWSISSNNTLSQAIRTAAQNGRRGLGIPIFFATGNGAPAASGISYPASLSSTIAVGASTNLDQRSNYSQFGNGIDFVAPSSGGTLRIETTDVEGTDGYNGAQSPNGDYCNAADNTGFGGTSSSTPLAAGVSALMLSVNPALSADTVRTILRQTSDKIDSANANYNANGWSTQYGYGRVNAREAVGQTALLTYFLSYE